jgi:hypothetical protein
MTLGLIVPPITGLPFIETVLQRPLECLTKLHFYSNT